MGFECGSWQNGSYRCTDMYDYSENHAIFTVITKGVQTTDVGFPDMVQQQSPETQQNQ